MSGEVFVLCETYGDTVDGSALELLTWGEKLARPLNTRLVALILGDRISKATAEKLLLHGADRVVLVSDPVLSRPIAHLHGETLALLARKYRPSALIAAATVNGRAIMPYAAALLETGLTADCTELSVDKESGCVVQTRPAIGGNVLATILTRETRPQMATVRLHSADPHRVVANPSTDIVYEQMPQIKGCRSAVVCRTIASTETDGMVQLSDAEIVVAIGRGCLGRGSLDPFFELARELNAGIGASRAVIDRGVLPYPHQIGLSGKTVAPRVYLALGISGAVQHLAGMSNSGTVIAINSDPDAPIFAAADLGIVGDVHEVVPALHRAIHNSKSWGENA